MSVSRNTNDVISGFGASWRIEKSGCPGTRSRPAPRYAYTWSGKPAIDSARIRTQAYTAVVCIAVNSLTRFPAVDRPNRNGACEKRYTFCDLSRVWKMDFKS